LETNRLRVEHLRPAWSLQKKEKRRVSAFFVSMESKIPEFIKNILLYNKTC